MLTINSDGSSLHRHEPGRVLFVFDFESSHIVLGEERDDAKVGVGPDATRSPFFKSLDRYPWVMVQTEFAGMPLTPLDESAFRKMHGDLQSFH